VDATKTSFITLTFKPITSSQQALISSWVYGKEKIRGGGGKKFARLFWIVPELSKKIFWRAGEE
jgi:hypothetical protein